MESLLVGKEQLYATINYVKHTTREERPYSGPRITKSVTIHIHE